MTNKVLRKYCSHKRQYYLEIHKVNYREKCNKCYDCNKNLPINLKRI